MPEPSQVLRKSFVGHFILDVVALENDPGLKLSQWVPLGQFGILLDHYRENPANMDTSFLGNCLSGNLAPLADFAFVSIFQGAQGVPLNPQGRLSLG